MDREQQVGVQSSGIKRFGWILFGAEVGARDWAVKQWAGIEYAEGDEQDSQEECSLEGLGCDLVESIPRVPQGEAGGHGSEVEDLPRIACLRAWLSGRKLAYHAQSSAFHPQH